MVTLIGGVTQRRVTPIVLGHLAEDDAGVQDLPDGTDGDDHGQLTDVQPINGDFTDQRQR